MSWAGISNENEFYSEHYLAEVFSGDIKDLLDAWLEQERSARAEATSGSADVSTESTRAPYNRLASLAREWQQTEREFERARSPRERLVIQRPWLQNLCDCLGLPWHPVSHPLNDRCSLPLLAELTDTENKPVLWVLEALPQNSTDADPLTLQVDPVQLPLDGADSIADNDIPLPKDMQGQNWQQLLTSEVYIDDNTPRWIILALSLIHI